MSEFQTRSETNGLQYFQNGKEAFLHAKKDPTVWKISFDGVRLVRKEIGSDIWLYSPIERIIEATIKEIESKKVEESKPEKSRKNKKRGK